MEAHGRRRPDSFDVSGFGSAGGGFTSQERLPADLGVDVPNGVRLWRRKAARSCGAGLRRVRRAMRAMAGSLGGLREDAIPVDLREAVLAAFRDLPTR
jgi:hypothetical protein